jgi:aryl-alcohol dehydrogenase-like predicted oxidoreductase
MEALHDVVKAGKARYVGALDVDLAVRQAATRRVNPRNPFGLDAEPVPADA